MQQGGGLLKQVRAITGRLLARVTRPRHQFLVGDQIVRDRVERRALAGAGGSMRRRVEQAVREKGAVAFVGIAGNAGAFGGGEQINRRVRVEVGERGTNQLGREDVRCGILADGHNRRAHFPHPDHRDEGQHQRQQPPKQQPHLKAARRRPAARAGRCGACRCRRQSGGRSRSKYAHGGPRRLNIVIPQDRLHHASQRPGGATTASRR